MKSISRKRFRLSFNLMHAGEGASEPSSGRVPVPGPSPPRKVQRVTAEDLLGETAEEAEGVFAHFHGEGFPPPPSFAAGSSEGQGMAAPPGLAAEAVSATEFRALTRLVEQLAAGQLALQKPIQQLLESSVVGPAGPAAVGASPKAAARPSDEKVLKYKISSSLSSKITAEGAQLRKQLHKISQLRSLVETIDAQLVKLAEGVVPA